jgi:hypothetical protein
MPTDMLTTEDLLFETPLARAKEESLKSAATLTPDLLRRMNAYWRAANYVSVGQIYLYDNPLLKEPAQAGTRQALGGFALGNDARAELYLRSSKQDHQEV